MNPKLNRIMLYVRDVQVTCAFYESYFGFTSEINVNDRVAELIPKGGGATIMVHPAGKGIKGGQAAVKLVFDVEDVESFKEQCMTQGLRFGTTHHADGYSFTNAKDPDGNSISISSRAFAVISR